MSQSLPLDKLERFQGPKMKDSYIVLFKPNTTREVINRICRSNMTESICFLHLESLNACAGKISEHQLGHILSLNDVKLICEDGFIRTQEIQHNSPWGISRLSRDNPLHRSNAMRCDFTYCYQSNKKVDVDVYVVDTGIHDKHFEFLDINETSRVTHLQTDDRWVRGDDHGHGTHCAGTIGGTRFGVAKDCKLISVRIMNANGTILISDLINGLNRVAENLKKNNRWNTSVVNLSIGSPSSTAIDDAVESLIGRGTHIVVAAGNTDIDAQARSPARVEKAITVGATTFTDSRAWFSNQGSLVDVYAPGVFITSATVNWQHDGTSNPQEIDLRSGTSMACAHVSGLVAYLLGVEGAMLPGAMKKRVIELSQKVVTDIPPGSNNRLANFSEVVVHE